jgi:N-acetylglucosamine kinase-like BadF-type ATPase
MENVVRYYLGADVGATKTHVLIADGDGRAAALGIGGPGNPDNVGYEGLARALDEATDAALSAAGVARERIAGAGFGISGYDWPSQREAILDAVAALKLDAPVEAVNDAVIGLLAGAEAGWGVSVVAGTSCNCWGWDQGRQSGRMTGYSWLGEAAGAYELVVAALNAVALQWTHRGPATRLTEAFVALTGVADAAGLLEGVGTRQLQLGSEAAPLVFRVAAEGDPVAHELVLWAGRELGSMANGVIRQLGFQEATFDVVLAGNFFNGSPLLAETMRGVIEPLAPNAQLVRLEAPPAVGAVLLGMEAAGAAPGPAREALITSTAALMGE